MSQGILLRKNHVVGGTLSSRWQWAVGLGVIAILGLAAWPAEAELTLPARILGSGGTIALQQRTLFVGNSDVVVWVVANNVAHACDAAGKPANQLRVTFSDVSPIGTLNSVSAGIPAAGGLPAALPIQLSNPLAARKYSYSVDILDGHGTILCSADGELVKSIALTVDPGIDSPEISASSQEVNDGDSIIWTLANAAAHQCDAGIRTGVKFQIVFDGAVPVANGYALDAEIPAAGDGDPSLAIRLQDPLPVGSYPYEIQIVNQLNRIQCRVAGQLTKTGGAIKYCPSFKLGQVPCKTRPPRVRPPRPARPPRPTR